MSPERNYIQLEASGKVIMDNDSNKSKVIVGWWFLRKRGRVIAERRPKFQQPG
jgi:hypothetical protein